jgi:predicted Zn-ribbon and HTH transcriptional regulator
VDIKPIGEDEYHKQIENMAGSCKCSGKFAFDALPRCPKCRSTDITEGETIMHYD